MFLQCPQRQLVLMLVPLLINWYATASCQPFTTKEVPIPIFLTVLNPNMQLEFHKNSLKSCDFIVQFWPKWDHIGALFKKLWYPIYSSNKICYYILNAVTSCYIIYGVDYWCSSRRKYKIIVTGSIPTSATFVKI